MPKRTFFNLSDEKRRSLLKAAEREFSRVPLAKASVSNIIKMAGIPRGSFYQYFENIEDLYYYLVDIETEKRKILFIKFLKKHNGDIIQAATDLYKNFLEELPDENERNFFKLAMLNVTHRVETSFTKFFNGQMNLKSDNEIIKLVDKELLNITNENEIFHCINIVTSVALRNFIEKFTKKLSDEEALKNFYIDIKLLKYGLYKRR
ncbi:TetR/AcrR family transcriptional regulator [Caldibacillus thermolactis]|jgi:AcrR family transcriptional regulator|uniref:TetR/AcrR family transcriptional regulator n=1 Tax=Pallidibacillus thermolactis TaxID=251051 RepID=A0ABT2WKT1_9BACI|nr:TetR/AcrR family transcriptional regulator [Pallidibacillus thermolactis]MCU9595319.1 TetR/AcrR family transcriptional regulator [Pallidibacillus thermolactis]MCU9601664.1 TetR/AcrR family transcriptional regulator [Pallidibacillus thermolactis subsp. kokeshiiformis]